MNEIEDIQIRMIQHYMYCRRRFGLLMIEDQWEDNYKTIEPDDFIQKEGGAILMKDEGRRTILKCWQDKKKEIIEHPFIGEKIQIGLIPYVQAQLLARFIRGDLDEYPPFLCKL